MLNRLNENLVRLHFKSHDKTKLWIKQKTFKKFRKLSFALDAGHMALTYAGFFSLADHWP